MRDVGWALAFVGLVALLQGVAWLAAGADASAPRRAVVRAQVGMLLAPVGLSLFALGLTTALVPGWWG